MLDLTTTFSTFPVLQTQRFILREITLTDAPAIFEIMGDERVARFLGRPPLASLDEAVARIHRIEDGFREKSTITWGVTEPARDHVVGTCGLFDIDSAHLRAELGYAFNLRIPR